MPARKRAPATSPKRKVGLPAHPPASSVSLADANNADETLESKDEATRALTFKDLEIYQGFRWLLDDAEKDELASWVSEVLKLNVSTGPKAKGIAKAVDIFASLDKAGSASASSSSSGPTSSSSSSAARGDKRKSADQASEIGCDAASIMKFFKR